MCVSKGKWPVVALGRKPSQQQEEKLNVGGVRVREAGGGWPDEAHAQTVPLKCKPAKLSNYTIFYRRSIKSVISYLNA